MYFVYVLKSHKDEKLYIGFSANINKRIEKHLAGKVRSTKFRLPLQLIYYEAYLNRGDARGREKFLKGGSGHKYLYKQLKIFLKKEKQSDANS